MKGLVRNLTLLALERDQAGLETASMASRDQITLLRAWLTVKHASVFYISDCIDFILTLPVNALTKLLATEQNVQTAGLLGSLENEDMANMAANSASPALPFCCVLQISVEGRHQPRPRTPFFLDELIQRRLCDATMLERLTQPRLTQPHTC